MVMKKKIVGKCKLCESETGLTFEHIPPQSAFNNKSITEVPFNKLEGLESFDDAIGMKGKISQRGLGGYYLCNQCNNNTGSWYGASYAKWAEFTKSHLGRSIEPKCIRIHPLRVIKQIVSNFVCIRNDALDDKYKALSEFVLDRDKVGLPKGFCIYIAGMDSAIIRNSDYVALITKSGFFRFSEIVFPPFVYMLTINSECPDKRLTDISHFASYSYDDEVSFKVLLNILPVNTPYPGDYRSKNEIYTNTAS